VRKARTVQLHDVGVADFLHDADLMVECVVLLLCACGIILAELDLGNSLPAPMRKSTPREGVRKKG
jgi:hypothetical protein